MLFIIILIRVLQNFLVVSAMPEDAITFQKAAERFQESVQQQTFQSVLMAIEDRLRNLDNIYTMQLSETLKSKLDQYSRKLDFLDTKLIRLESMVMLNLNQISENISSKNYKDDMARTQLHKKMETYYEGLSHRLNYVDRKNELAFDKIQNKVDSTLQRLERMEEDMIQRNSDIESELSETLSILEEYRSSTVKTETTLVNITYALESTVQSGKLLGEINIAVNNIFSNLTKQLDTLENSSTILDMKKEIKNDFNLYANKVSDMNMEIWKRNDMIEKQLKIMETTVNSTRVEVQNGMRALMVQIGKSSGKAIPANDKNLEESWQGHVNVSLEKLLLNQDLFMENCHRVQMDESQIESEISQTLGKLIDMLETKMTTVMKDLKILDKTVKNHDSKAHRNLNQANSNIISLFEKSALANENTAKELQDIKFYINSLFTYLQDVLPKRRGKKIEDVLNDVSSNVSTMINLFNNWNQQIKKQPPAITNVTEIMPTFIKHLNLSGDMQKTLNEIKMGMLDIQKHLKSGDNSTKQKVELPERKCAQNYGHLIDVRGDFPLCNDTVEDDNVTHPDHEKPIFQEPSSSTTEDLSKTLIEIFGTPPPRSAETTITDQNNQNSKNSFLDSLGLPAQPTTEKMVKKKDDCLPQWTTMINVRTSASNENCTTAVKKNKKKKKRKHIQRPIFMSRFNTDDEQKVGNSESNDYKDEDSIEASIEINTDNRLLMDLTSTEVIETDDSTNTSTSK